MKYLITILILFTIKISTAQKIIFVRICNSGINNTIYWQEGIDTCRLFGTINLYAKENETAQYYKLDSNLNTASKSYIHKNANIPSIKNWEYKIEYKTICGTDTLEIFTDSLLVDDIKPDSSILDSVSVNPINNQVYLGWSKNKTPDFAFYYLYNSDRVDPRLAENYVDTFYIDASPINPQTKPLTYDITSSDSCDNRRDYGKYFHQTIWLRTSIDTCLNEVKLIWSKYIGWEPQKYFIFRRLNGGSFLMIAEITDTNRVYLDKNTPINSQIEYFVRAHGNQYTSTSNSSYMVKTGKSSNPSNTEIEVVTANTNKSISIIARPNPINNYSQLIVEKKNEFFTFDSIGSINLTSKVFIDNNSRDDKNNIYRLVSKNACRYYSDTTIVSGNIVLGLSRNNDNIKLSWTRYFTWNNAIEKHIIYRASGNNIPETINFMAISEINSDTFFEETIVNQGSVNCYFIEAIESTLGTKSRSNTICSVETGDIFYPNAIVINGTNSSFTFIGKSIELNNSTLEIYDRWGNQVYSSNNLSSPWTGIDNNNNIVQQGVYFFIAKIKRNEEILQLKGTINVIN